VWKEVSAAKIPITELKAMTEVVLKALSDPEALAAAGAELQRRVWLLTTDAVDKELAQLLTIGPVDRTYAAYSAAAKQWARENKLNVLELHGDDALVQLVRVDKGVRQTPKSFSAIGGVIDDDDFMQEVVRRGELILDFAQHGNKHGVLPHVLQQIAVDLRLKQAGQSWTVTEYRQKFGLLNDEAVKASLTIGKDGASPGVVLWNAVFDPFEQGLGSPEILTPEFLRAVGLDQGDL